LGLLEFDVAVVY